MVYEKDVANVYSILKRVIGDRLEDRELRFLAVWIVLTLRYGYGDALAGYIARMLLFRYGVDRTFRPLLSIAEKLGVRVKASLDVASAGGGAWYIVVSEIINAVLTSYRVKEEVYCALGLLSREACDNTSV